MGRQLHSIISERFICIPNVPVGTYEVDTDADYFGAVPDYDHRPNEMDRLPPWLICDWKPDTNNRPQNIYRFPLKDKPTLHREFASLKEAKERVKFATDNGFLGFPMLIKRSSDNGHSLVIGESLKRWTLEIASIKKLLDLWDSTGRDINVDYNKTYQYVCEQVNRIIKRYVYPQILPRYDGNIYFWVPNLLASFYVMFAWDINDSRRLYCPGCHIWFKPKSRSDAKTCSVKCRQRVNRAKRRLINK